MLGFSLVQAAVFGSLLGALVSVRPTPSPGFLGEEEAPTPRWRAFLGAPVDAVDRLTYDWRHRELGGRAEPADRQSRRAQRHADPTEVASGHIPALPQPPRSAEGRSRGVISLPLHPEGTVNRTWSAYVMRPGGGTCSTRS